MDTVESSWKGVNEVIDPANLAEGYLSLGRNIRCEDGKIKNRGGHRKTVLTNKITDGNSPVARGTIYGSCEYIGSDGERAVVYFGASEAYYSRLGTHCKTLAYPAGETIDSNVMAFQADNEIRVMRGRGNIPFVLRENAEAFTIVDQSTPISSYERMPSGQFGIYAFGRIFILDGDVLKPSLIGEFDLFDPLDYYEIDTGTNDIGTGIFIFDKNKIVVTKENSIYAITDVDSSLEYAEVIVLTKNFGCQAPKAIASVGGDLWIPTASGVYPVSQLFDSRYKDSPVSVADPIKRSYEMTDFSRIEQMVGVVDGGYYYLATPVSASLKDETGSFPVSRVLVYSIKNGEWMGYDEATTDFDVAGFAKLKIGKELYLCGVSRNGYIFLYGYDQQLNDTVTANGNNAVSALAITRGYGYAGLLDSKHIQLGVRIRTQNPKYSLGYAVDGVSENGFVATDKTMSASQYSVIGKTDFDGTNNNGDFFNPYRQDYSLYASNTGFVIENNVNDLEYILLDIPQDSVHRLRLVKNGRYFQIKVLLKRGFIEVVNIGSQSMQTGKTFTKGKTN